MNMQAETEFFHDISKKVIEVVKNFHGIAKVTTYKKLGDYATEVDVTVENIIVAEINKIFPADAILAEEGYSDAKITNDRIWVIDPICGTGNLGRGLASFCTNIALVENKQVIAACVVDHSRADYFWSVGDKKVHINDNLADHIRRDNKFGLVVDIDFGALFVAKDLSKDKYAKTINRLMKEPGLEMQSMNSSLCFAYTAIGRIDGFINLANHPWDICAASFLIKQAGGVITGLDGKSWALSSVGAIGARTSEIHKKLLDIYLAS